MTTPATRDDLDKVEEKLTDKVVHLHDRQNDFEKTTGERLTTLEVEARAREARVKENTAGLTALGADVSNLDNNLQQATGTFERVSGELLEAEGKRVQRLEDEANARKNFWTNWRNWMTPTNIGGALLILGVLLNYFKGDATEEDVRRAVLEANQMQIEAAAPVETPTDAPAQ